MALALSRGFAGVFSHLQGAVRERQRLCYLLDVFMKGWITANCNCQSMASRVPSRGLTARDGAGAGTLLGIVAIGSNSSIRWHQRYPVVSRACSLTCQVPFERLAFDLLDVFMKGAGSPPTQLPIHGVARAVAPPHGPRRSGGRYFSWHCCGWQ